MKKSVAAHWRRGSRSAANHKALKTVRLGFRIFLKNVESASVGLDIEYEWISSQIKQRKEQSEPNVCLLYTSDAADE